MNKRARQLLGELDKLEAFIGGLERVGQRRVQRRRDDALGVLPTREIRPGVFAVVGHGRGRLLREARELLEDLEDLGKGTQQP